MQEDDEVTCLVTFDAPALESSLDRPGEHLILVVDRSGSMSGAPIAAVRASLHSLVDRMKPQDTFGLVAFSETARMTVPTRRIADHDRATVHRLIEDLTPGGSTDLSAGYLLGLSEARRHSGEGGSTVLLLSDGHANAGVKDPEQLAGLAAQARQERITTGTIGLGSGYDERLLAELARSGNGPHRFAATPDDAVAVVAEEAGDLLNKSVINAFLRVRPTNPALISGIGTLHTVPRWLESDEQGRPMVVIPMGDLFAGEHRELLLHFAVPALAELGLHELATLTIDYVAMPALLSQTISWPLAVNVVPGDAAAGRVADPSVMTARLLAEATRAKDEANQALGAGDIDQAEQVMRAEMARLDAGIKGLADCAPAGLRERLLEEQAQLDRLVRGAREVDALMMQKSLTEDLLLQQRGRDDAVRRTRARNKRDY
ncbi:MAG: vWA domain-containing protein [Actinomycetales bacterium]